MSDKEDDAPLLEDVVIEETKIDEEESRALEKGWKRKEDFEGDPKLWRDHKTFLEKGELFETIHALKRRAKEHDELLEKFAEHNKKIEEVAYTKALETIRQEHRAAVEIGDVKKAEELTDKLVDMSVQKGAPEKSGIPKEVTDFIAKHKDWFNKSTPENSAMTAFAESLESQIHQANPELTIAEVLVKVEATIKQKFPSRFRDAERAVSPVAPARSAVSTKESTSIAGLPKFQQEMVKSLKRRYKNFDVAAYIKQVNSIEEGTKK